MKNIRICILAILAICAFSNAFSSEVNILYLTQCEKMYCIKIYNTEDKSRYEVIREAKPVSNLVFDKKKNSILYLIDSQIKIINLQSGKAETMPYRNVTSFIIEDSVLVFSTYSLERLGESGIFIQNIIDSKVDTLLYRQYVDSPIDRIKSDNKMDYLIIIEFDTEVSYSSIGKINKGKNGNELIFIKDVNNLQSPIFNNNSIIAMKGYASIYFDKIINIDISSWSENVIHSCNDGIITHANYSGLRKIVNKNLKENIAFIGVETDISCDNFQALYKFTINNQHKTAIYDMRLDGSSRKLIHSEDNIISVNYYSSDDSRLTFLVEKEEKIVLKMLEMSTGHVLTVADNIYIDPFSRHSQNQNGFWIH